MKKVYITIKVILLAVFGILGGLSLIMFPLLIGAKDSQTSMIGFTYLALLLISISVIFFTIKKDLNLNRIKADNNTKS
ncbi:hypothetical protein [uncultured Tenacibaculum sp.]|uniref:hypothetical protein n=1 Tax=uncultured Tenacibaculum sp. TaxID=174713 RepID=UPI00263A2551|nr:hypothetical protein [uncultured Tenacibaculum sp.]